MLCTKKKKKAKQKTKNRKTKKQASQCTIFQIFEGSNGSSPNLALIFSLIKDNSFVFFLAQTLDQKSPSK